MTALAVYLALLTVGIALFVLHHVALLRVTRRLREAHPAHWAIVAPAGARIGKARLWLRMQHVLRSPALPAIGDARIDRWQRIWRFSPWLAWACWLLALLLQWQASHR